MWSDLESLVEASMQEWKVPGLALAVIQDGEVVLQKGYGVRDTDTGLPVTTDTQFLLCSITKSFTAAGLGLLVDERKLDWDRPVRELLPEFRLQDPVATERLTVRDLLCHHSGLPRHDWIHMPGDLSNVQMLAALRHLASNKDLRDTFQYSNLGYLVAGMITERISGQRYEDFTTERLMKPLGFSHFGFSIDALGAAEDGARPHAIDGDELHRSPLSPIRATPAGGINASVADLAKWARFLLDGKADGRQLLSPQALREMTTPRVHMGRSPYAEIGDSHYGLGLFCEQYRGDRTVAHSGSWAGWSTLMTLLPERRAGVVVLTNRTPGGATPILTFAVLDRLCGREPVDWFGRLAPKRKQAVAQQKLDKKAAAEVRHSGTRPSHALEDYVGDYEHPAYGRIHIEQRADGLAWRWRGAEDQLLHRHYDVFITPDRPTIMHPSDRTLTFRYDRQGHIDRVEVPLEEMVEDIVFRRVAAGEVLDPAFRRLCAGDYLHAGRVIEIRLDAGEQLGMTIPGQPTYRLLPAGGRRFNVETLEGYGVEFRQPSPEVVDAMVFHEPRVTALAPRIANT
ncbi:CubicO group peptidase (beta-lactamase class C family) [Variovorax boronicumulans]|uniref:serine hydrolase n=1 Tax=Variovorax boronicumulans TaxID=436515 RepID=UPI002476F830|nr:serine hydrolase [Variovorax boronicumulans]MDH6165170.1 CubicO group peptidase (beta-lactamase class C family) [Variovorax boronicumulans]